MFQKNGRYRGMHKFGKDKGSVRIRLILADVAETSEYHSALFQQGRMAPANTWTIDAAQSGLVGQNQLCIDSLQPQGAMRPLVRSHRPSGYLVIHADQLES